MGRLQDIFQSLAIVPLGLCGTFSLKSWVGGSCGRLVFCLALSGYWTDHTNFIVFSTQCCVRSRCQRGTRLVGFLGVIVWLSMGIFLLAITSLT